MLKRIVTSILRKKRFAEYSRIIDILTEDMHELVEFYEFDEKLTKKYLLLSDTRKDYLSRLGFNSMSEYVDYKFK